MTEIEKLLKSAEDSANLILACEPSVSEQLAADAIKALVASIKILRRTVNHNAATSAAAFAVPLKLIDSMDPKNVREPQP